jgi:hypothetical protein
MSATFAVSLLPVTMTTINETTGETSARDSVWYFFPDEVKQLLAPILARHGFSESLDEFPSADYFLGRIELACRNQLRRVPWAVVFFPEEYPLLGHLLSIRPDPESLKASAYSLLLPNNCPDRRKGIAPPLSFVLIASKDALRTTAASGSPLVTGVFESLRDLEADGCWVHFANPIDPAWVASAAKTNDLLFSTITGIAL